MKGLKCPEELMLTKRMVRAGAFFVIKGTFLA